MRSPQVVQKVWSARRSERAGRSVKVERRSNYNSTDPGINLQKVGGIPTTYRAFCAETNLSHLSSVEGECCSSVLYDSLGKHASRHHNTRGIAIASIRRHTVGHASARLERRVGAVSQGSALTEEGPMECARCDGLMVGDSLIDIQESSIPMWMKGWRCVSCGNIVDHSCSSIGDPTGGSGAVARNETADAAPSRRKHRG